MDPDADPGPDATFTAVGAGRLYDEECMLDDAELGMEERLLLLLLLLLCV
jgi:hypothetical protein